MMQRVLIVNCFETYEHRVELLRQFFQERGCTVKIVTSDWLHMDKTVRRDWPEGYEMVHVKPYRKNLSPQRLMSHDGFAKAAQKKMEEYRPDLLWVLIPPNSLAKTAGLYKKRHPEVKLVLDLIDMWPETMPIHRFKKVPPFVNWQKLRDNNLQYADAVVTECTLFQTILGGKCAAEKMHTLYLTRESRDVALEPRLPENKVALCYLGSINNIIDIPCISQIIQRIDCLVDLHIIGDGEKRQELIKAASLAGANVFYHGKIYDQEEKQRILDQCHFGLNIMKDSVFVGLTMKSMDYFEGGLPIINNIKGDTWHIVEEEQIGINYTIGQKIELSKVLLAQENREKVRSTFEKYFTKDRFCEKLDRILGDFRDSQ